MSPAWRAAGFYRDVALALDTVTIDVDRWRCLLSWRGHIPLGLPMIPTTQVVAGVELPGQALCWQEPFTTHPSTVEPAGPNATFDLTHALAPPTTAATPFEAHRSRADAGASPHGHSQAAPAPIPPPPFMSPPAASSPPRPLLLQPLPPPLTASPAARQAAARDEASLSRFSATTDLTGLEPGDADPAALPFEGEADPPEPELAQLNEQTSGTSDITHAVWASLAKKRATPFSDGRPAAIAKPTAPTTAELSDGQHFLAAAAALPDRDREPQ